MTGLRQAFGQLARHAGAKARRIARADKRHHRPRQQIAPSQHPKQGRRIGQVNQRWRVSGFAMHDQIRARQPAGLDFGQNHAFGADRIVLDAGGSRDLGQCRKRRGCRSMFCHQPEIGRRTNPAGSQETKPRTAIILFVGGGEGVG